MPKLCLQEARVAGQRSLPRKGDVRGRPAQPSRLRCQRILRWCDGSHTQESHGSWIKVCSVPGPREQVLPHATSESAPLVVCCPQTSPLPLILRSTKPGRKQMGGPAYPESSQRTLSGTVGTHPGLGDLLPRMPEARTFISTKLLPCVGGPWPHSPLTQLLRSLRPGPAGPQAGKAWAPVLPCLARGSRCQPPSWT